MSLNTLTSEPNDLFVDEQKLIEGFHSAYRQEIRSLKRNAIFFVILGFWMLSIDHKTQTVLTLMSLYFGTCTLVYSVMMRREWWQKHCMIRWCYEGKPTHIGIGIFLPYFDLVQFVLPKNRRNAQARYEAMLLELADTSKEAFVRAVKNGLKIEFRQFALFLLGAGFIAAVKVYFQIQISWILTVAVALWGVSIVTKIFLFRLILTKKTHSYQKWIDQGRGLYFGVDQAFTFKWPKS
jgi:hypothetical protein